MSGDLLNNALDDAVFLAKIEQAEDFASVADSLSGEIYANTQLAALNSAQAFSDRLMSCSDTNATHRFVAQEQCAWLSFGASRFLQDDNEVSTGFDQNTYELAGGAQYEIQPGTHLGFALALQDLSLDMDSAQSDGEMVRLGLVAKREIGPALITAALSGGWGTFDSTRTPATGGDTRGSQDVTTISGLVRGSYEIEQGKWTVIPQIDLGIDYVQADGFDETGSSNMALVGGSSSDTYVHLRPAVKFGHDALSADGTLYRTSLSLGLSHYLTDEAPRVTSKFNFANDDVGFVSAAQLDRTTLDLGAGLEVIANDRFRLSGDILASFSKNSRAVGAGLTAQLTF